MRVAAAAILALASAATVLALPPADQPENIIIKLSSDGHSGFSVRSSAAADGTGDLGTPIGDRLRRVRRLPDETTEEALKRLQSMDGVEWAHPDLSVFSTALKQDDEADPSVVPQLLPKNPRGYKKQWGSARIGMPVAWSIATGAVSKDRAVTVCVVDSGVDYKHPDLLANLAPGVGFNAVNGEDSDDPRDFVGHGTEVAGVIAASGVDGGAVGINWKNINLLSCKFMDAKGWGQTSDAVQCLDWCRNQGAHIISASWTSGSLDNPPLEEAVARIDDAGILLVVSAGNQGLDMRKAKLYPQAYAAHYDNMVVVAATDMWDEHVYFSNWDSKNVHLHAPGDYIYTTVKGGGNDWASGTSIAAPFVSGTAALLLAVARDQLNQTLSTGEMKELLLDSAERIPALKGKSSTGGRLRTDWVLQTLLGRKLAPPTGCIAPPGSSKCKHQGSRRKALMMQRDGAVEVPGLQAAQVAARTRRRRMQVAPLPSY